MHYYSVQIPYHQAPGPDHEGKSSYSPTIWKRTSRRHGQVLKSGVSPSAPASMASCSRGERGVNTAAASRASL